ncbi:MAG: flagellar biosynthetic protein FliR [Gammaproteobacteria bacterium]
MHITDEMIMQWVGQYFWPLCRVSAFMLVMPILSARFIMARVRLGLALAITVAIVPYLPPAPAVPIWSAEALFLIVNQILIGAILGFFIQLFFQVFQISGQFVAMQNGLGFATLVDPVNGINVAAVGQIFLLMTNLLFLALGGHLIVLEILISSFQVLPLADSSHNTSLMMQVVHFASWMFRSALLVALPSVTALLITNVAFGVVARVSPQLNIFSVGFPFNMAFGLVVLWVMVIGFLPIYESIAEEALLVTQRVLLLR